MISIHRCPVCSGNGLVPCGFYAQTSGMWSTGGGHSEECRSCKGKGWITLDGERK